MSPDEAPSGTVCTVGHPSHGKTARKDQDGVWRYVDTGLEVDIDDVYRSMNAIWIPS